MYAKKGLSMIILSILLLLATFTFLALFVYDGDTGLGPVERDVLLRLSRAVSAVAEADPRLIDQYIFDLNKSLAVNNNVLIVEYGYVSVGGSTYFYIVYMVEGVRVVYIERIY